MKAAVESPSYRILQLINFNPAQVPLSLHWLSPLQCNPPSIALISFDMRNDKHAYPGDSGLEAFPLPWTDTPLFVSQRRKAYGVTQPQPLRWDRPEKSWKYARECQHEVGFDKVVRASPRMLEKSESDHHCEAEYVSSEGCRDIHVVKDGWWSWQIFGLIVRVSVFLYRDATANFTCICLLIKHWWEGVRRVVRNSGCRVSVLFVWARQWFALYLTSRGMQQNNETRRKIE